MEFDVQIWAVRVICYITGSRNVIIALGIKIDKNRTVTIQKSSTRIFQIRSKPFPSVEVDFGHSSVRGTITSTAAHFSPMASNLYRVDKYTKVRNGFFYYILLPNNMNTLTKTNKLKFTIKVQIVLHLPLNSDFL